METLKLKDKDTSLLIRKVLNILNEEVEEDNLLVINDLDDLIDESMIKLTYLKNALMLNLYANEKVKETRTIIESDYDVEQLHELVSLLNELNLIKQ
jgi:hypothetical protein